MKKQFTISFILIFILGLTIANVNNLIAQENMVPEILSISPNPVYEYDYVTILGQNFKDCAPSLFEERAKILLDDTKFSSYNTFSHQPSKWTNEQIIFQVGGKGGKLAITNCDNLTSNDVELSVKKRSPVLASLEPSKVYERFSYSTGPGETITVYGTDFGNTDPGSMYQFYLNGQHLNRGNISSWTNNSFKLYVPYELGGDDYGRGKIKVTPDDYELQIQLGLNNNHVYEYSNKITFTVLPACTQDEWECGEWSGCSASGKKQRTCTKTFDCPSIENTPPTTIQSCTYIPACSADTWQCGNWSTCSPQGIQTRSCAKTYDCPTANTIAPITSQNCSSSQQPQTTLPNKDVISFDNTALRSVFQIKIYDTILKRDISWGTGMAIGGAGTILTNYHVAKLAITEPNRYKAYACVVTTLNSNPNCKHLLSITENLFGSSIGTPKYDQKFDLALLYMNQIYVNDTWKSWTDVPLADWGFSLINLSDYTTNYRDLSIGEAVHAIGYPDYGGGKTIQVDGVVTKYHTDQQSGQPLIVSDFKISFGNSGGPVFNSDGELIGVTVACFVDSNGKCTDGLFIPLPTVDWWYANQTNSKINTWGNKKSYGSQDGIPDEVWREALCSYPLRQNAYYNPSISKDSCTCKPGYSKNSDGECVDESGYVNPSLRYGKPIDVEGERKTLSVLEDSLNKLKTPSNSLAVESQKVVDQERKLITKVDTSLSRRVSGNILLQVESKGEGWYVNPDNEKKYYLGRPADAFGIMRNLGLGIKHSELANYLNTKFPSRLSGKILLDVEQNGEAYYVNPNDLKGYFLNRPADAFRIMRELGLGITNSDIRKIDVGETE